MERRSEARTGFGPWLEHLAWNAAAAAAVSVMLLVLLASLEWLDAVAKPGAPRPGARASAEALPVVAGGPTAAAVACAPASGGSG